MFIVILHYKKPIEIVDQYIEVHRAFLDDAYKKNLLIASGPQVPRKGGIILSNLKNRDQLGEVLKNDPFLLHGIAEYEVLEFNPIKYHPDFAKFVM